MILETKLLEKNKDNILTIYYLIKYMKDKKNNNSLEFLIKV